MNNGIGKIAYNNSLESWTVISNGYYFHLIGK